MENAQYGSDDILSGVSDTYMVYAKGFIFMGKYYRYRSFVLKLS